MKGDGRTWAGDREIRARSLHVVGGKKRERT